MFLFLRLLTILAGMALFVSPPLLEAADPRTIGIVIMHGQDGSPTGSVSFLASSLAAKGYQVANLEMPWSDRRNYDVAVSRADEEVVAALTTLRAKGARRVFVAGHSMGGTFAMHFAVEHTVDGVIAISPGGDVSSKLFQEGLGVSVAQARQLVVHGKGDEPSALHDIEGTEEIFSTQTTPRIYLSWYDANGAMNLSKSVAAIKMTTPALWIVAKNDYARLRKSNLPLFQRLPANPLSKLYEPDSDHAGSPSASLSEVVRWTNQVSDQATP